MEGNRSEVNGLWYVELPTAHQICNTVYHASSQAELVKFLHGACFSPTISTFVGAIKAGYLKTWPGLTVPLVNKWLPKSMATAKGHLDQQRRNIRSTKRTDTSDDQTEEREETMDRGITTHLAFVTVETVDTAPQGKIYSDITGRFPTQSSQGNKYVYVLYDYDSNAIMVETLQSRAASEILKAFQKIHHRIAATGRKPHMHILDNEASDPIKNYMKSTNINYQLVPPHVHRRNAAERAIRTFKNHFVAGLATTNKRFPLHLWDRLLEQAEMTLNLLWPARNDPEKSACYSDSATRY